MHMQFHYTAQNPSVSRARNITEKILEEYLNKELDEVVIIYTKMLNGVQTETETRHLLPLEKEHFNKNVPVGVQMEQLAMVPSAEALMENIIPIYIQGFVYGALVESYASEHNLRMLAMQSATDSASAMLNDLSIQYNRVRQAAITQEITEVVSGCKGAEEKEKALGEEKCHTMNKGKIVQVMGPVVDVEFENNDLPYIKDALEVDNNGKKCIMEVAQHIGNNTVRCIMLSSSEGFMQGYGGCGYRQPVSKCLSATRHLGRLFNVFGETIDGGEQT